MVGRMFLVYKAPSLNFSYSVERLEKGRFRITSKTGLLFKCTYIKHLFNSFISASLLGGLSLVVLTIAYTTRDIKVMDISLIC